MKKITRLATSILIIISLQLHADESLDALHNSSISKKIEIMKAMGYAGNKSGFWIFVKYLSHESDTTDEVSASKCRQAAAEALGRIRDTRAIPYLIERYSVEKNIDVKRSIMFAMRFYDDKTMTKSILDGIKAEDNDLKFQSILASEKIDDDTLLTAVTSQFDSSTNGEIKTACAYIIYRKKKTEEQYKFLLSALSERDPDTRYWAAHYLGEIESIDSAVFLTKAIEIESIYWVKRRMEDSLTRIYFAERERRRISEYNRYEKMIN